MGISPTPHSPEETIPVDSTPATLLGSHRDKERLLDGAIALPSHQVAGDDLEVLHLETQPHHVAVPCRDSPSAAVVVTSPQSSSPMEAAPPTH